MADNNENSDKVTKRDAINLILILRELTHAYGFFAEQLGKIEQKNREMYKKMFNVEIIARLPEIASKLTEKNPEVGKLYTKVVLRMAALSPQLNNLMDLPAKEKIVLGKNLIALSQEFEQLKELAENM